MSFLLDTNVISAAAPSKAQRPTALIHWMARRHSDLYLSVVTASEVRSGIAKARRSGAAQKADMLEDWWNAVEHLYSERILPFDLSVAGRAGAMVDIARSRGLAPGFIDIMIAATAEARGLVVLTRNLLHFTGLLDVVLDPFDTLPP